MMSGTSISGNRLLAISGTSRIHTLAARARIRAVCCCYRLFKFESESVQVFSRLGEHFSFSIGGKLTQQHTLGCV